MPDDINEDARMKGIAEEQPEDQSNGESAMAQSDEGPEDQSDEQPDEPAGDEDWHETEQSDTLEDILLQYTYYFGPRKSQKDKQKVYGYISDSYKEMGYDVYFGRMLLGLVRVGYCVAGDVSTAKHVYIAPLDTKNYTHFRQYRYYPFREKDSNRNSMIASIVDFVLGFLTVLLGFSVVFIISHNTLASVIGGLVLYAIYMFALRGIMTFSPSAGLALMHYMALHDPKKDDAYVFIDRCVDNYVPIRTFLIKYKTELTAPRHGSPSGAQIFFMNNLAHSDNLVFASDRDHRELSGLSKACGADLIKLDGADVPRCTDSSDRLVFVTGADMDGRGRWFVDNIRRKTDRKMNVTRLKKIAEAFLND